MIGSILLTALLASAYADDGSDAVPLIGRLGAETFDDRVAAYKALERLGSEALPALRSAADTSDPRVRSRVRALIDSIGRRVETDRFSHPTMIQLGFRDRALGEIVEALNDRHDLGLDLRLGPAPRRGLMVFDPDGPKRLKALRDRTVTLEVVGPVPFWEAVDRLCEAASLRYDLSPQARFGVTQSSLVLMADRTGRGPASDSGPFRVQVTQGHAVSERDFTVEPGPARPGDGPAAGVMTVSLAVLVEPGLAVHQSGPVRVEEAADDRGRSLSPPAPDAAGRAPGARRVPDQTAGQGSFRVDMALSLPDPPAKVIRRLRGTVPVVALARQLDPLVIPLNGDGPQVRTFQTRDLTLAVDTAGGAGAGVTVTVRPDRGAVAKGTRAASRPLNFGSGGVGYDRGQQHMELYDAAGRRLDHVLGAQMRGGDGLGFYDRYRLTPRPAGDPRTAKAPVATELRYYEFVQKEVDVRFEFRDIPMP